MSSTHLVVRGYGVERTVVLWAGLAVVLAILMCAVNSSAMVLRAGFFLNPDFPLHLISNDRH